MDSVSLVYQCWRRRSADALESTVIHGSRERHYQPFAANPSSSEAMHAFRGGLGSAQFAETPRPVDLEDFEDFADEWTDRFALAVKGQLRHPGYLPFAG